MDYILRYENWLNDNYIDEKTKAELLEIKGNNVEIQDRFFKDLEFGTGGMRGVLGAGTNRLNIYTIRKATQGLANYILSQNGHGRAVVIAHDCRRMSADFTKEAALVLAANGLKAYVFDSLRPTPVLSFAVRELKAISGIVVTASHNPPEYNGYKVYWDDGGQCPYPRDEAIINEVNKITDFSMIKTMDEQKAVSEGLYIVADSSIDDKFNEHVLNSCQNPDIIKESDLKIVFTPLHGAGNIATRRALKEAGFKNVSVVKEQELPDGNFPTVSYPNPEEKKAFALALELANENNADILIATDPDCDRVGVAVKHKGEYVFLTGNHVGVLLTEYICSQLKKNNRLPKDGVIISTIVSTDMTAAVANEYGLKYMEVLTGFKYIGEKIKEFEINNNHTFVLGFEESYGYLAGTYARDKDAVGASLLIAEAAAFYKLSGKTLVDILEELYNKYGLFHESVESITLKGVEGIANIGKIMTYLRETPPTELNGSKVISISDYKSSRKKTGSLDIPIDLPVSDVLYFSMEDKSWVAIRPSGTEPKIKLYYGVVSDSIETAQEYIKTLKTELGSIVDKALA